MIQKHFEDIVLKKFGFDFSPTQKLAVERFSHFFFARHKELGKKNTSFILPSGIEARKHHEPPTPPRLPFALMFASGF